MKKEEQQLSYRELKLQLAELTKNLDAALAREHRQAIDTCMRLIAEYGLTAFELGLVKTQEIPAKKVPKSAKTFGVKKAKASKPPKYVDPATGATWSGYGHTPKWIVGNRDDYLIKHETKREQEAA